MNNNLTKAAFIGLLLLANVVAKADMVGNVDIFMSVKQGTPTVNIPLDFPEMIDGLHPKMSINYRPGVNEPLLGHSFALSGFSEITRCRKTLDDDGKTSLLNENEDNFCINGKRLIKQPDGYYYAVTNPSARFTYTPYSTDSVWREETSGGFINYYQPRHDDSTNAVAQKFVWAIVKTEKRNTTGEITYQYDTTSYHKKPISVRYGGFDIHFNYEQTDNHYRTGRYGAYTQDQSRIQSIELSQHGVRIKKYQFSYTNVGKHYVLSQVGLCFENDAECLKPAKLSYDTNATPDINWMVKEDTQVPADLTNPANAQIKLQGDVNADGITDFCTISMADSKVYCNTNGQVNVWLDIPGIFSADYIKQLWKNSQNVDNIETLHKKIQRFKNLMQWLTNTQLVDIDNDGYNDLCLSSLDSIRCVKNSAGTSFNPENIVDSEILRNNNGGMAMRDTSSLDPIFWQQSVRSIWTDINDDGLTDVCAIRSHMTAIWDHPSFLNDPSVRTSLVCFVNENGNRLKYNSQFSHLFNSDVLLPITRVANMDVNGKADFCYSKMNAKYHTVINAQQHITATDPMHHLNCRSINSRNVFSSNFDFIGKLYPKDTYKKNQEDYKKLNRYQSSMHLVDVSNDGIADLCYVWENKPECLINKGKNTYDFDQRIRSDVTLFDHSGYQVTDEFKRIMEQSLSFKDWNDDGEVDVCWIDLRGFLCAYGFQGEFSNPQKLFEVPLSDKSIFTTKTKTIQVQRSWFQKIFNLTEDADRHSLSNAAKLTFGPIRKIADTNGNGLSEFCYQYEGRTHCRDLPSNAIRIKSITNSLGAKTQVEYTSSSDSSVYTLDKSDSHASDNIVINPNRMLVSKLMAENGLAGASKSDPEQLYNTFEYKYKNYIANIKRGRVGFKYVGVLDATKSKVTLTQYYTRYPYYGLKKNSEQYFDNTLKTRVTNNYISISALERGQTKPLHVVLTNTTTERKYGSVTETASINYSQHDHHGYAKRVDERTWLSGSESTARVRQELRTYKHLTDNIYLLGLPATTTVHYSGNEGKTTTETNEYNSNGQLLNTVFTATGANSKKTTYNDYNALGFAQKIIHEDLGSNTVAAQKERTERRVYNEYTKTLTSETNALGHTQSYSYQGVRSQYCQKPSSITDANNLTTTYTYDALCRVTKTTAPDGSVTENTWQWDASLNRGIGSGIAAPLDLTVPSVYTAITTHYTQTAKASELPTRRTLTYHDLLGRTLRQITEGDRSKSYSCTDHNADIFIDYAYDRFGNLAGETRPYYSCLSGSVYNNAVWLVTTYDNQGRKTKHESEHDGNIITTRFSYTDNTVNKYYQWRHESTTTYGIGGQLESVVANPSGSPRTLAYSYDAMGNLARVKRSAIGVDMTTTMTYTHWVKKPALTTPTKATGNTPTTPLANWCGNKMPTAMSPPSPTML